MRMRQEIENPMVEYEELPDEVVTYRVCTCGCGQEIEMGYDHHIVMENGFFATEECVTDFFMREHGGRWA